MTSLSGKRLMILGGNRETGSLVEVSNELGIHSVVVDPNPKAPAKRFATEHYEIDGFDVEGVVELGRKLGVDGVLVGVADVLVRPYLEVCARLALPCYATPSAVDAFAGKNGFKATCSSFGLADIPGILVDRSDLIRSLRTSPLPAMIKPVDSGGGVGMRICASLEQVESCARDALDESKSSHFLIERVMDCDDMFVYYTIIGGRAYLSATADRITTQKQPGRSPVCVAARYPSRHTEAFVTRVHPRLIEMFRSVGLRDGVLCIQFFVDDGEFHAYDPGFRLQGEAPHLHLASINGFDHRHMLINFALTGSMGVSKFSQINDFRLRGRFAATLWVLLGRGRIACIRGLDSIQDDPAVNHVVQRLTVGDVVTPEMLGTERQVLSRIYIEADSAESLVSIAERLHNKLAILDEDGRDMLLDWVKSDSLG